MATAGERVSRDDPGFRRLQQKAPVNTTVGCRSCDPSATCPTTKSWKKFVSRRMKLALKDQMEAMLAVGMKISPHAWPFAALALAVALALGTWVHWAAAHSSGRFSCFFTLWFFRDPERDVPARRRVLLVSPADGTIIRARADKISIFMSVFNVHICRAPAAGKVLSVKHHPGRFLAAWKDEAAEQNERVVVDLDVEGQTCSVHARRRPRRAPDPVRAAAGPDARTRANASV